MKKIIALCGRICSGKTRYARSLLESERAVLLSMDEATYDLFDNAQGEIYDVICAKTRAYLLKKAAEIAGADCTVILDWGFWTREDRRALDAYFVPLGVPVEWRYIEADDATWERNITERNRAIRAGENKVDFYVDEGLRNKLLRLWEEPSPEEIRIRVRR